MKNDFVYCPKCVHKLVHEVPPGEDRERLVCSDCRFIYYNNPKPTASAIIEQGNCVLLVKRAKNPYKGDWDLVGGFIEVGESVEQALAREVFEETGLEIKRATYYFSWTDVYTNATDNHVSSNLGLHFLVETKAGKPRPGDDSAQVAWFAWDNLPLNIAQFHDVVKVLAKRQKEVINHK